MYIQLEYDYNADTVEERFTGVYVHINNMNKPDEEGDFALIRIEDGDIVWYESQNGDYICEAKGKYVYGENLKLICEHLLELYPNSDIDTSELDLKWLSPDEYNFAKMTFSDVTEVYKSRWKTVI